MAIINLKLGDMSSICSTLLFAKEDQSQKFSVNTLCITFD